MATTYHSKSVDKGDRTHPQTPVPRPGSAHGVPSGSTGAADFGKTTKGGATQTAHGVPGGGRRSNSPAYAVPPRSRPSPTATEHKENASKQAGAWPGVGNPTPNGSPLVNQQPRVPFSALQTMTRGSGQQFPYGASPKSGFGFDRLRGGGS